MTEQSQNMHWEYRQLSVRSSHWSFFEKKREMVVAELNDLGRDGWEVAESCMDLGYTQYFILRRPATGA